MTRPRVLLVGPEWVAGWTESTARGLQELGCTVEVFYYVRTSVAQRVGRWRKWLSDRLGRRRKVSPSWMRASYWRLAGWQIEQPLIAAAREFRPDVVLVLKGEILTARVLALLKEKTGASLAAWWVDDPYAFEQQCGLRNVKECLPLYDCVFIFDRHYLAELKAGGVQHVEFLPCAADPVLYHPQIVSEADRKRYEATVSLIGIYFPDRGKIVREMIHEPGLRVWGPGWEWMFHGQTGGGGAAHRGEKVLPEEIAKIYCVSLINLNSHQPQTKWGGLNTRAFEIPAVGGFQLVDYVHGMEELLEPGREVVVYKEPQQAAELVREYLRDASGRARIARAGHERVLAQHTYRHRMATVLNTL